MELTSENDSDQNRITAEIPVASLGTTFREARERLGLSVADVANQIKFAPRQIEALEADDFKRLPEATFLRGFIRSYAKIMQLDAQKLLAALPQAKESTMELAPASVNVPFPDAHSLLKQNLIWLTAAALLAMLTGAFALWNFMSPVKQTKVVQVETPVSLPAEVQIIQSPPIPGVRATAPAGPTASRERFSAGKAQSSVPAMKTQVAVVTPQATVTAPAAKSDTLSQAQLPNTEDKSETKPETKPESKSWWQRLMAKPEDKPETMPEAKPEAKPEAVATTPLQTQAAKSAVQSVKSLQTTQLRLEFGEESWTEIKDRDGKIISSQINPRGSELIVNGHAPFSMLIGHGLSVRLYREGKQVDLTPYINKYSEVAHVTLK